MDFSNRNVPTQAPAPQAAGNGGANNLKRNKKDKLEWARVGVIVVVVAVAVLLVSVIALLATNGSKDKSPSGYVDSKHLQAVFLNTGQVYFGNIKSLNSKYFVLTNIYYLQTANQTGSNNANPKVTLVKLGCELHEPYDQMVINADQVTFWENLQDNGQVAQAVSTFEKQNPQGQKCADQSTSSSSNSGSSVQSAGSSSSSTTPATTKP